MSLMMVCRDGSSMEVQVDVESKLGKLRHHSGSSSMDDGSTGGRGGGGCSSGCPHEGKCGSSRWAKESSSSSSSSGKKSKGKLRKKGGGTKINETREDMDAQLLEQRSTNSSEFDSPSLSGSLPSVADSHCSHFSEFSCSDLDACRPSCCSHEPHPRPPTAPGAVSPLPEVEHDRLENCPASAHLPQAAATAGGDRPLRHIAEENASSTHTTELEPSVTAGSPKERNNNLPQPASPVRNACIQTEI